MSSVLVAAGTRRDAISHARNEGVQPLAATTLLASRPEHLTDLELRNLDKILFGPGHDTILEQLVHLATRQAVMLDTTTASALLDVPPTIVSRWKRLELLQPAGLLPTDRGIRGGVNAPLYRLADLLPLAAVTQTNRARRRRHATLTGASA